MNVIKCKNGHFYDADKFETCPHCGETKTKEVTVEKKTVPENQDKTVGIFGDEPQMPPVVENEKDVSKENERKKIENDSEFERKALNTAYPSGKETSNNEKTTKKKIVLAAIIPSVIIVIASIIIVVLILNSNKNNNDLSSNQINSQISVTSEETKSKGTESTDSESITNESITTSASINSESSNSNESSDVAESSANSIRSYSVTNDEEANILYDEMDQNVGARFSFTSATIQNDQGYYFLSFSETGLPVRSDTIDLSLYENKIVSGNGSVKYEQKEDNNTFYYLNIDNIQSD